MGDIGNLEKVGLLIGRHESHLLVEVRSIIDTFHIGLSGISPVTGIVARTIIGQHFHKTGDPIDFLFRHFGQISDLVILGIGGLHAGIVHDLGGMRFGVERVFELASLVDPGVFVVMARAVVHLSFKVLDLVLDDVACATVYHGDPNGRDNGERDTKPTDHPIGTRLPGTAAKHIILDRIRPRHSVKVIQFIILILPRQPRTMDMAIAVARCGWATGRRLEVQIPSVR
mmetsp:Transcript_18670/g.33848  ORF Transcript_18670/g.33848 Transcript_18670/m.33848 type:complete len:228 (+) Transcript_18670:1053-1736(+)